MIVEHDEKMKEAVVKECAEFAERMKEAYGFEDIAILTGGPEGGPLPEFGMTLDCQSPSCAAGLLTEAMVRITQELEERLTPTETCH